MWWLEWEMLSSGYVCAFQCLLRHNVDARHHGKCDEIDWSNLARGDIRKAKKKYCLSCLCLCVDRKWCAWIGVIKCIVRKIRRKLCRSSSDVVRAQLTENGVQTDTFRAYRLLSALSKPYAVQFCFSTIFISITHTMPRQIHIMQDLLPVVIVVSCAYHIIHFRLPSIFNHCSVHWYDDNSIAARVCVMLGIVMYPLTWRYQ